MIREFSVHLVSTFLFPQSDDRQYLMRSDFLKKLDDCAFLLVKPHELRKKYTEFVWQNKARALLPTRVIIKRGRGEAGEESKDGEGGYGSDFVHGQSFRSSTYRSSQKYKQ